MVRTTSALHSTSRFVAMLAILPLVGCYSFAPTTLESVAPGQTARVVLDNDGFGRVINQAATAGFPVQMINAANNRISGRVEDLDGDAMWVQMRGVGGSVFSARVATGSVQEVSLRRFSAGRTVIAIAGGAVLTTALIQGGFLGGSTTENPDIDPEFAVPVPLFSIPIP